MGRNINGKELGEGISQLKNGRYTVRWSDRYGKRHTKYVKDLKEAKKILFEGKYRTQTQYETGVNDRITLNELFDIYVEDSKYTLRKSTLLTKESSYKKNVRNFLGKLHLKQINKQTIRAYLSDLEEKEGYNPRNALNVLKPLFSFAVAEEYMLKNPTLNLSCAEVRVRKSKGENDKFLTRKQQKVFVDFLLTSEYKCKYAYLFLLGSGLRIGELLALKVEDIDVDKGIITVDKTLKRERQGKKKVLVVGETKSKSGIRNIPLTELSFKAYSEQLKMLEKDKITLSGEDILFPFIDLRAKKIKNKKALCKYTPIGTWDTQFKELVLKCKEVHPDFPMITPHSLRHTFATRCFEGKVSAKATQTWLGHASATMTQYYQHLTEENIKPEIEKLSGVMKV